MKTVEEIITQSPVFLGSWDTEADVFDSFHVNPVKQQNIHICFAVYSGENYEGVAFVIFSKNGKLYEVNGAHCSCDGLEGQWEPEAVSLVELQNRLLKGTFGTYTFEEGFNEECRKFLGIEITKED